MMDPWNDMTLGLGLPGEDLGYDWLALHSFSRSMSSQSAGTTSSLQGTSSLPPFPYTPMKTSPSGRKHACKMCSQTFDTKSDLQLHVRIHDREQKPFRCTRCTKCFANSSYLSQHMRIHLGIKPYLCDICKRNFTQLSHLQQHLRTHTGDKPYQCFFPACHKAFSQLSNLQSHSRCHETDKPFRCHSCYKSFYDEQSLREHIPRHKDSKHSRTHLCAFCGKAYTQHLYLATHIASKHSDKVDRSMSSMRNAAYWWSKSEDQFGSGNWWSKSEDQFGGGNWWSKSEDQYSSGSSGMSSNQENVYTPTCTSPYTGLTNSYGMPYPALSSAPSNDYDMWNSWSRSNNSAFSAFYGAAF